MINRQSCGFVAWDVREQLFERCPSRTGEEFIGFQWHHPVSVKFLERAPNKVTHVDRAVVWPGGCPKQSKRQSLAHERRQDVSRSIRTRIVNHHELVHPGRRVPDECLNDVSFVCDDGNSDESHDPKKTCSPQTTPPFFPRLRGVSNKGSFSA
jgi:hypothetical protein